MAQGVPTPPDVEIEFRTHYLRTGNIRAASRYVGISHSTGQQLADRAQADPEFVQSRAAMYARALPDAERLLVGGLEIAAEQLEAGPQGAMQDPGPAYLRAIADGVKVLSLVRKGDAGPADTGPAVVVNLTVEAPAKPATDAA